MLSQPLLMPFFHVTKDTNIQKLFSASRIRNFTVASHPLLAEKRWLSVSRGWS
jgi:hypothetical protein